MGSRTARPPLPGLPEPADDVAGVRADAAEPYADWGSSLSCDCNVVLGASIMLLHQHRRRWQKGNILCCSGTSTCGRVCCDMAKHAKVPHSLVTLVMLTAGAVLRGAAGRLACSSSPLGAALVPLGMATACTSGSMAITPACITKTGSGRLWRDRLLLGHREAASSSKQSTRSGLGLSTRKKCQQQCSRQKAYRQGCAEIRGSAKVSAALPLPQTRGSPSEVK